MKRAYFMLKRKYIDVIRELDNRNSQLLENNKEMSDSLNYAKRIQRAILPPAYYVEESLPSSFILYMPKDVVSGDFYFVEALENEVIFSAVDCTGHGVPGAMMSVVGFKYIEQAVNEKHITCPADIMQFLDVGVNDSLRQTDGESGVKDGMDLAICNLNRKTNVLQYSGTFNSLYIIPWNNDSFVENNRAELESNPRIKTTEHEGNTLYEIKPDRLPIGVNEDGVADVFTNHSLQLEEEDAIYLFSDGYADQFGGERGKKFLYKRFKKLLLSMKIKSMLEQREELYATIKDWMGDTEAQIDDILVLGVRV